MILNSEPENQDPATQEVSPIYLLRAVMVGVLIWGTIHAVGVALFSSEPDFRKPVVVYGCVLMFLAFWNFMLWIRSRSRK